MKDAPVINWVGWAQRAADGANWFVSDIENEKEVIAAQWMTTALGVYDIFVNGELIGDEILKPGFTDYRKTKYSYTYDITEYIKLEKGAVNRLSAQVTPGWWADRIVTPSGKNGMNGKKCAFRGVLQLTYTDGSVAIYGTDIEHWKAGIAGKVRHAAIYDGEIFDDREPDGFDCLDYLSIPEINTEFNGEILPTKGAEVYFRNDLTLTPTLAYVYSKIENTSDEEYGKVVISRTYADQDNIILHSGETLVVDFGQNCSAVPSFIFKAKEGTKLRCLPGEILNDGNGAKSRGMDGPEGSVHRKNLRIPDNGMYIEYIFGNHEDYVRYTPRYSFFGFRYIDVSADDEVEISQITSIPISSITKEMEVGKIATGNAEINQLLSNTLWSQRSNYLSIPTDCPNRNERMGWLADTQIFCETGTYFADTRKFFHKWMQDVTDSQFQSGAYPTVAPISWGGENAMCCGWSDAGIIVPYTIFKQYGDIEIIKNQWDSMERCMHHIKETEYEYDKLEYENLKYVYGDWLSYEPLETYSKANLNDNGEIKEDAKEYWNYLSQSYWLLDARLMKFMARAIGNDKAFLMYEDLESEIREKIRNRYFTTDGEFKLEILNTMQTPALFALMNNLFDEEARDNIIQRLKENFKSKGNCLSTGFLGTSILMKTLTENGMSDIAYDLLFQHRNPSWLYSIDNGATTIWERWDSYTIENGLAPSGMNSFNHYAYGSVCEWIWKNCAGISADPSSPGFKHIILTPIPDDRLGFVDAEFNSPSGLIRSNWEFEGDNWIWKFTVPEGTTASVTIPGEGCSEEYDAGSYEISCPLNTSNVVNPMTDKLIIVKTDRTIEVHKRNNEMIDIFDINGINILTTKNNSFDTSSFSHGIYIIKIGEKYSKICL
ncbi:MAG: family 78 glycoside hydrolase catalytic domain [Muribaculaceae bacterium]|nr:family 78 glycoside hydrolase catalytic domain [Muribaculaceae bacterium]